MKLRLRTRVRFGWRQLREIGRMIGVLGVLGPRVITFLRERVGAGLLAVYSGVVLLLTLAPLGVGFAVGSLVDSMAEGKAPNEVRLLTVLLIVMVVVQAMVGRVQHFLGETVRNHLWFAVMHRGAYAVASLSPRYFNNSENRALIARVNEHGRWRVAQFADSIALLVLNLLGVLIAWILIRDLGWWLPLMAAAAMVEGVVELFASLADRRLTLRESERWRAFWNVLWSTAHDEYTPEHQLNGTARRFAGRLRGYGEVLSEKLTELRRIALSMRLGVLTLTQCVLCLAVWHVANQALTGKLSPGELSFLVGGLVGFGGALSRLASNLHDLCRDGHVVGDFFKVCDTAVAGCEDPAAAIRGAGVHPVGFGESVKDSAPSLPVRAPQVSVEEVTFNPERGKTSSPEKLILKGISMQLNPGGKYVFIGESGSGKTTLMKLLTRLEDPTSGRIRIDGVPLSALDEMEWRRSIGTLSQRFQRPEPFTIREILGLPSTRVLDEITRGEMEQAMRAASFWPVFQLKGENLDQLIGKDFKGGTELSEGEWQRLKLAALFLRNAPVLVLDEPTSGLDPGSSSGVMEQLFQRDGKTLILVTHWLRHCPLADRIFVMRKGLVVEEGTHEELMALRGEYARLYADQLEERAPRDRAA